MLQSSTRIDSSTVKLLADSQASPGLPIAWMLRRLRTTMWIAGLLIGVQTLSALPSRRNAIDPSGQSTSAPSGVNLKTADPSSPVPVSTDRSNPTTKRSRAVLPHGWRRTADGWQHVSSWAAATRRIPLSQRIVAQQNAQPVWMRNAMDSIRQIPPGSFALAQLVSVGLLFWLVNRKKVSVLDQTCLTTSQ